MKYEFAGDSRLLKEIEVKASRIPEEYTIEYRTKRPYGRPNYVLKAKDINTTYGNLLLSLPSKFPGLVVRQSYNLDESPRWVVYLQKNYVGSLVNQPEVVVTINDTFVGGRSGDILGTIDPTTVETVELRTSVNVMYGSAGMGGVLAVYTKQGVGNEEVKITKDTPLMKVIGYSKPGLFRFPNYADPQEDASRADFRSLLYWNPNVTTDPATGTATLSFFASDLDGRYYVVVEGVSKNGLPVRSEYFIDVVAR